MANAAAFSRDAPHDARRVRRHRARPSPAFTRSCILRGNTNVFHRRALAICARTRRAGRDPAAALRRRERAQRRRSTSRPSSRRSRRTSRRSAARRCTLAAGPTSTPRRRDGRSRSRTVSRCSHSTTRTPRSPGWTTFPRDDWPPVAIVHIAFQIMVALGTVMALVSRLGARGAGGAGDRATALVADRKLLRALALVTPHGLHRHRSRLDRDGGRPTAVDRLRRAANRRRGDANARPRRPVSDRSRCSTCCSASSSCICSVSRSCALPAE